MTIENLVDPAIKAARAHLLARAEELGLVASTPEADPVVERPDFAPLVSVIVPAFNDERFVAEALDSIRHQSYQNWECLVVDDASTDGTWDAIRPVIDNDSRFKPMRLQRNSGPAVARNLALDAAKGEYTAFLDGDDLMLRYSLEDRVAALATDGQGPFVAGSYSGARFGAEECKVGDFPQRQPARLRPFVDFVIADGECPFSILAPLVRTEVLKSVGGFDRRMRSGAADWELWHRVLRNGYVFVAAPVLGAVYRQNGQGFVHSHPGSHTKVAAGLIEMAHRRAPGRILRAPTPYPMREPIGHYRLLLKVAERAVRFASIALVAGKQEELAPTLAVLTHGTWPLLDRHLDIPDLVKGGAARARGLNPADLNGEDDALRPFADHVIAAVREASS